MVLKGIGLNNGLNKRVVKIYDVSLKQLIKVCESVLEASEYTGIPSRRVSTYIKNKTVNRVNNLNIKITLR
jgi:hypothetical protein